MSCAYPPESGPGSPRSLALGGDPRTERAGRRVRVAAGGLFARALIASFGQV
jgi:hypothetical protein